MRAIIAAAAMLLFCAYDIIERVGVGGLRRVELFTEPAIRNELILLVLALYLVIECLLLELRKRKTQTKPESQSDYQQLQQERDSFKTAFEEAKERLKNAEVLVQAKQRPQAIDAELVNLLFLFQDKGRLVDFLMDDITPYNDAQVGAAARVVHQGCSSVLREYFSVSPIHGGKEGDRISLPGQFDSKQYRLIGQVSGDGPYNGAVIHRGWKTTRVDLPRLALQEAASAPWVIAPAEIEL